MKDELKLSLVSDLIRDSYQKKLHQYTADLGDFKRKHVLMNVKSQLLMFLVRTPINLT